MPYIAKLIALLGCHLSNVQINTEESRNTKSNLVCKITITKPTHVHLGQKPYTFLINFLEFQVIGNSEHV